VSAGLCMRTRKTSRPGGPVAAATASTQLDAPEVLDLHQACGFNEAAERELGRDLVAAAQPLGPRSHYGDFFPFTSASLISFSSAVSMAFSPGAPTHLCRITPVGSRT
jgi:hypothetical protein